MSFPRASSSEHGLSDKALGKFVSTLEEVNGHSFMLIKKGFVIAEGWWAPYKSEYLHTMFSVTKSFTSIAIGFAVDEGRLSVEDKILSFFEGVLPSKPCENMQKITVKNLLTMSSGHTGELDIGWNVWAYDVSARGREIDHVYEFLTSYVPVAPGTEFHYNTSATYMLGVILTKLTGLSVLEYLKPRLLEPLGIAELTSESDSKGYGTAGFGFQTRTEDLAKFCTFLLHKGKWNGHQLLSEEWVEQATKKQIETVPTTLEKNPQYKAGYGYQFWRCSDSDIFRADGLWGQYGYVCPSKDLVLVVTAGSTATSLILDAALELIETGFETTSEAKVGMSETLSHLSIKGVSGVPISSKPLKLNFRISKNPILIDTMEIDTISKTISFSKKGGDYSFAIGEGQWIDTKIADDPDGMADYLGDVACSGAWIGSQLVLKIVHTRTPYTDTLKFDITDTTLLCHFSRYPFLDTFEHEWEVLGIRID
ncbi:beta-lactamase family protein [Dipodascopsis uninucleata]